MEIEELIRSKKYNDFASVVECLQNVTNRLTQMRESVMSDLIDMELVEEIKSLTSAKKISILFGKTLRDMKFIILDNSSREHDMIVQYNGPRKLNIISTNIPYTSLQEQDYASIEEILVTFQAHFNNLNKYFYVLEQIDKYFVIAEPINPTFKDDYRKIVLDDRIWLHIEVSPDGLATNMHLIGRSEEWHEKLQEGLLVWDHDKDILENIIKIFGSMNFPCKSSAEQFNTSEATGGQLVNQQIKECCICLCAQLPDDQSIPQPLCQNPACDVYFHRNCLYQWLVAYGGGRSPAFGVATGNCPTCLQPIVCSEKDN